MPSSAAIAGFSRVPGMVACLWLSACLPAAAGPGETGDARRGARLLQQYQCGACHAIPGIAAARGTSGPPLDKFGLRSYIAGRVPNRPDLLVRWLQRPSSLIPSTTMPDMGVPLADARDMAAWLAEQR